MRLFAALWPSAPVLDHLDVALAAVRSGGAGEARHGSNGSVRWSARETWHLTAAFYGELPDAALDELADELAGVARAVGPFELRLRGAGVFAHRTLWVGAGGDLDATRRLFAGAAAAGRAVGVRDDERVRSRPHLTIGRLRAGRPDGRRARASDEHAVVAALAVYESPAWLVETLTLVESRPGAGRGGGPLYRTIAELPLADHP